MNNVKLFGKKKLRLPYTVDFSTKADGKLPKWFLGDTFSIASGKATNTPEAGANILADDPGLESAYTDGLNGYVTVAIGAPTVAESADAHGGTKAQQATATGNTDAIWFSWPRVNGIIGAWFRFSVWAKRTAGANGHTIMSMFNTDAKPGTNASVEITSAAYKKYQASLIAGSATFVYPYGFKQNGAAGYDTVVFDDGVAEKLTSATLFALVKQKVSRLASVKVKPATLEDGTWSGVVAWASGTEDPDTFLLAAFNRHVESGYTDAALLKCVAGTWTVMIASTALETVEDAWLEIRPVDNDTVGLYYNNVQVGGDIDVADVPGKYCGFLITGGNNVKGFFVG